MRATLFATLEFPPHHGGVSHVYASLCHHLPAHQLTVVTPPVPGGAELDRDLPYHVVRTELLSTQPWVWPKWWMSLHALSKLIDRHHIQRLVVGQLLPLGTVAWLLHQRRGLPYVVFVHGMDLTITRGRRAWLTRKILANAESIICNSEYTKGEVLKRGGGAIATHVVYPGPHTWSAVRQHAVSNLDQHYHLHGAPVILCVGRMVERKGFLTLISAFAEVRQHLPSARLVIVGHGSFRPSIDSAIRRLGLSETVILPGAVDDQQLAAWYERCDVFTMVPHRLTNGDVEGFGLVYLEANRFGKPVVASRTGGVPEAVVDGVTGLLVPEKDPKATAQALLKLLNNPSFAHRLGMQGLARVERDFNWHVIGDRVAKLLS